MSTEPLPQISDAGSAITEPLPQIPEAGNFVTEANVANRESGWRKRVALVAGAVMFFGIGAVVGSVASDPTASDEYTALAASKAAVEDELDGLQADYNGLREDYSTLFAGAADRETDIKKAERGLKTSGAAVKKREEAVASAERKREAAVSAAEKKRAEKRAEAAASAAEKAR